MKQQFKHMFAQDTISITKSTKENVFNAKLGTLGQEKLKDQQEYADRSEVSELSSRMKILMSKLTTVKKEKESLLKENQNLQQEIIQMQSHYRCMVTGFSNTGSTFPMVNELMNSVAEFYKCECFDMFFDVLCPELSQKGIIFFYTTSLQKIQQNIDDHFAPAFTAILQVGSLQTISGPIINVLRKSFQTTHQQIEVQLSLGLKDVKEGIQKHLKLTDSGDQINQFLEKLCTLMLNCYISDPPLCMDYTQIGQIIQFNQAKHDPIDGFVKVKEECIILLPALTKGEEQVGKALVISSSYEIN